MPHSISCEACGAVFAIPEEIWDKRVRGRVATLKCRSCKAEIHVDGTAERPASDETEGGLLSPTESVAGFGTGSPAATTATVSMFAQPPARPMPPGETVVAEPAAADLGATLVSTPTAEPAPTCAASPEPLPVAESRDTRASSPSNPATVPPPATSLATAPTPAAVAPAPAPPPSASPALDAATPAPPPASPALRPTPSSSPVGNGRSINGGSLPRPVSTLAVRGSPSAVRSSPSAGAEPAGSERAVVPRPTASNRPAAPSLRSSPTASQSSPPSTRSVAARIPALISPDTSATDAEWSVGPPTVTAASPTPTAEKPSADESAPPTGEDLWVVSFGEEDDRELTEKAISAELARGTIGPKSIVWRDGMEDWLAIADIPQLARFLASSPSTAGATKVPASNRSGGRQEPPRPPSSNGRRPLHTGQRAAKTTASTDASSPTPTAIFASTPGSPPSLICPIVPVTGTQTPSGEATDSASAHTIPLPLGGTTEPAVSPGFRPRQPTVPGLLPEQPVASVETPISASARPDGVVTSVQLDEPPQSEPVPTVRLETSPTIPPARHVLVDVDQSTVPSGPLVTIGDGIVTAASSERLTPTPTSSSTEAPSPAEEALEPVVSTQQAPPASLGAGSQETSQTPEESTLPLMLVATPLGPPEPPLDSDAVATQAYGDKPSAEPSASQAQASAPLAVSPPPADDAFEPPTIPMVQSRLEGAPRSSDGAGQPPAASAVSVAPVAAARGSLSSLDDISELRRRFPKWTPWAALAAVAAIAVAIAATRSQSNTPSPTSHPTSAPVSRVSLLPSTTSPTLSVPTTPPTLSVPTTPPSLSAAPTPPASSAPSNLGAGEKSAQDFASAFAATKQDTKQFDKMAAERAAEPFVHRASRVCQLRKAETSGASVTLAFKPSGQVLRVTVASPHAGTYIGRCLEKVLAEMHVQPFQGPPGEVVVDVPAR
jgi:hypothetical protein